MAFSLWKAALLPVSYDLFRQASQFHFYFLCLNVPVEQWCLIVKALDGTFNKENTIVGAFSVTLREGLMAALLVTWSPCRCGSGGLPVGTAPVTDISAIRPLNIIRLSSTSNFFCLICKHTSIKTSNYTSTSIRNFTKRVDISTRFHNFLRFSSLRRNWAWWSHRTWWWSLSVPVQPQCWWQYPSNWTFLKIVKSTSYLNLYPRAT